MTCYALIPAAGRGSRFAASQPKQYLAIAGKPMLWHAVAALCRPPVETVFVVLAPGDKAFAGYDWSAFAGKIEPLYCGGESRRVSPPQKSGSSLPLNALQSCLAKVLSPAASTTKTDSIGGMQTARTACQSIDLPASFAYCLGCLLDKRVPLPAAGIRANSAI